MPVPNTMSELSNVAGENYPVGSEPISNALDNYLRAHASLIRQSNALASQSMPSGSTVSVGNANGESVLISGSSTIQSLGAGFVGCKREIRFSGSPTLAHSPNLQLPGNENISVSAGDVFIFRCIGSNTWVMTSGRRITNGSLPGHLPAWGAIDPASKANDSEVVKLAGTQTISGAKTFSSEVRMVGNIIPETNDFRISPNTVDGSDTARVYFLGGGGSSTGRGAFMILSGNEAGTNPGMFQVSSGSGADVSITAPGATISMNGSDVTFSGNPVWHGGNFTPDDKANGSTNFSAGAGLIGGGTLAGNRSFAIGTPGSVTLGSVNSASGSTHTHAFNPGGSSGQYIRGNGSLATFPSIPNSSNYVATSGNQSGLSGNKAWSGQHTFGAQVIMNSALTVAGALTGEQAVFGSSFRANSGSAVLSAGGSDGGVRLMPNGFTTSNMTHIAGNGNMSVGGIVTATDLAATSDRRLKTAIVRNTPRRTLLSALQHYRYRWKDSGAAGIGVMAQDVRDVAPEYVHESEGGTLSVDKAGLALEMVLALADAMEAR